MRILIVEDDERIIGFLKRGLEAERHEVSVARDKQQGLNMTQARTYDLIILDIFLGQENGLDICRHLRQRQEATPVVVVTARDSPDAKEESLAAGANGYFAKPFSFADLLNAIHKLGG